MYEAARNNFVCGVATTNNNCRHCRSESEILIAIIIITAIIVTTNTGTSLHLNGNSNNNANTNKNNQATTAFRLWLWIWQAHAFSVFFILLIGLSHFVSYCAFLQLLHMYTHTVTSWHSCRSHTGYMCYPSRLISDRQTARRHTADRWPLIVRIAWHHTSVLGRRGVSSSSYARVANRSDVDST